MSVGDVRRCDVRWAERIARTMANEVNSERRDTHKRVVTLLVPTRPGYATFLVASGHSFEGSHQGCMRGAESGFGVRLFGFPNPYAGGSTSRSVKDLWAGFLKQILGHVLRSRIVRQDKQSAGLDHAQGFDRIRVFVRDEKTVVPMLIQPPFATSLEIRKIQNSSDRVLRFTRYEEIANVIVAVKMLALAPVFVQPMACAKMDAPHDCQTHELNAL